MNISFALTCRPRRPARPINQFTQTASREETHAQLAREIEFKTGRVAQRRARSEKFRKTGELA